MAITAVAADVLQALDVLLHLATQSTFNEVPAINDRVDHGELGFFNFIRALVAIDASFSQDVLGELCTDAMHVLQGVVDFLLLGNIDTGDAWHVESFPQRADFSLKPL